MLLNRIDPSRREKGRFRLELEDGRTLEVTENELVAFGLFSGMELAEEQIAELDGQGKQSIARMRAARMIAARPLSRAELVSRLIRKGEAKENSEDAADRMEKLGAIDDAAYAAALVRRCADQGYGPKKMKDDLYRRGIDRALWEQAMEQAPPPEEIVCRYFAAKAGRADLSDKTALRRVFDALRRRGFEWDEIEAGLSLYRESESD